MTRASAAARQLQHPRCGSEHLLLALSASGSSLGAVLYQFGVTETSVLQAVRQAGPRGAGAATDRDALALLGVDMDELLFQVSPALVDRPSGRQPLLPWGAKRARQRCAGRTPPLGLDAQAAYEASLRLALARRDKQHRPEHLALTLIAVDPGARWVLRTIDVDVEALFAKLQATFPPPRTSWFRNTERRIGRRRRCQSLLRRYQKTTGRAAAAPDALSSAIFAA